mmetsp:Transcript_108794/g.216060  ORF Transcript_108794/g.216060 Transcript_108794/m.216060 type:complete len:328 (+) Transcript_108794:532-1515(+)
MSAAAVFARSTSSGKVVRDSCCSASGGSVVFERGAAAACADAPSLFAPLKCGGKSTRKACGMNRAAGAPLSRRLSSASRNEATGLAKPPRRKRAATVAAQQHVAPRAAAKLGLPCSSTCLFASMLPNMLLRRSSNPSTFAFGHASTSASSASKARPSRPWLCCSLVMQLQMPGNTSMQSSQFFSAASGKAAGTSAILVMTLATTSSLQACATESKTCFCRDAASEAGSLLLRMRTSRLIAATRTAKTELLLSASRPAESCGSSWGSCSARAKREAANATAAGATAEHSRAAASPSIASTLSTLGVAVPSLGGLTKVAARSSSSPAVC